MRKVLPWLVQGVVLCLGGFAFFYLSRRLSSISSETSSETFENSMAELKGWKRTIEGELESQFERIRSIAGRIDRAKRKESSPQEAQGEAPEAPHDLDDQGKLNAILARRFHGYQGS